MHEPFVYIVIINWNGWKDTIECLESVFRSTYSHYRIIVCDNGSTNGSLEKIKAWADGNLAGQVVNNKGPIHFDELASLLKPIPYVEWDQEEVQTIQNSTLGKVKLIFIRLKHNLGFGKANNVAMQFIGQESQADYIWLLNNDTVIYSDTLRLMVQAAHSHSGITGSVLRYYLEPLKVQVYGGGYFNSTTGRVITEQAEKSNQLDFINGASFMLSKDVLSKVGLFDEQIFMYFEENDYCIRAQKIGFTMAVADCCVLHKGGASGGNDGNYLSWKNVYVNKCYVMRKHYGLGIWVIFSAIAWMLNLFNPKISWAKRRASGYALRYLIKSVQDGVG